ncbi:hypothetical protein DFH06DRAFT_1317282 [Mycena polygramma]|nr:hypothetical protein DFH06DRAFT_1317282 [Mycena polygramma]
MAGRHHDSLYSPVPDPSLGIDRNASYDSAVYRASVGSNGYRYHPHATSVDGPPEHYDSDYAHAPEAAPNLSHAMGRSAVRQPTLLPRLHIPNSSPALDTQRVNIAGSSFYSATATLSSSRFHSPSVRGPLSAPDASEDFRYHQLYEDPHRALNMQAPDNAATSTSRTPDADSPQQRDVSSVQPVRRTTSTTVIACRQCRSRKIRCDSTRPHCSNCSRRGDQCEYDPAPKRRGPDKKPGTRQRRSKKRAESREEDDPAHEPLGKLEPAPAGSSTTIALPSPVPVPSPDSPSGSMDKKGGKSPKRRRLGGENSRSLDDLAERVRQQPMPTPNISGHQYGRPIRPLMQVPSQSPAPSLRISTDDSVLIRHPQPFSSTQPPSSEVSSSRYAVSPPSTSYSYDVSPPFPGSSAYDLGHRPPLQADHPKFPSIPSPAVHAAQQGWWDAFLRSYTLREIATDLNFLYTENPPIALSFVNVRFLLSTLWDQTRRLTLQPAFVLASMALAMLIRSSETERGAPGRDRAAFLRHSAQDALERAWREGVWVDASLAEAALIIAQYEASAHPEYHPDRLAHALGFLDELLSALGLTTVDAGRADVCRYAAGAAPVVLDAPMVGARCGCIPLGTPPPDPDSVWASALPWDPTWDEHRVRDEECRRVCWAALSLVTSFRAECLALARADECAALRICDPANYLVLFPNEMYDRGQGGFGSGRQDAGAHPKNAIWALFCRSMLLANFCSNVVGRSIETREARETQAEALHDSWNEAQAIQDALDGHVCNLHSAVAYLCRENISNAQMIITKGLRNLQGLPAGNRPGPLFNRRQAEEWIAYQDAVLKRVAMSIQYVADPRGHQLTQRPFAVTWFYHQLAICLLLWENDTSLEDVLELAKSFLVPLDVMNALWPCELIEMQCRALRKRLTAHCRSAGHEPPPPANYTLPHQHAGHNP